MTRPTPTRWQIRSYVYCNMVYQPIFLRARHKQGITMEKHALLAPIPQPKPDPLLKNLKDMDPNEPVQGLMRLAQTYGPIFRLSLPERDMIVVSSQELVNELCDEQRFDKKVHAPLENIRAFAG